MESMTVVWNRVTRFSQLVAVVLFVGVFALGYVLGHARGVEDAQGATAIRA